MKKKLKIAFLMDPLESLDLKGDTTFALAYEAQKRNHKITHFKPSDLILKSNQVLANICKIELFSKTGTGKPPFKPSPPPSLIKDPTVATSKFEKITIPVTTNIAISASGNFFVALIFVYMAKMSAMDKRYGVEEE